MERDVICYQKECILFQLSLKFLRHNIRTFTGNCSSKVERFTHICEKEYSCPCR